ncbi:hypothetical protein B0H14DRAFT_3607952 [Mycena olivaceomarginata]|nr:hypothetical protein B0H14DRAFT_3607952 [Mycena olivaceomarginata]
MEGGRRTVRDQGASEKAEGDFIDPTAVVPYLVGAQTHAKEGACEVWWWCGNRSQNATARSGEWELTVLAQASALGYGARAGVKRGAGAKRGMGARRGAVRGREARCGVRGAWAQGCEREARRGARAKRCARVGRGREGGRETRVARGWGAGTRVGRGGETVHEREGPGARAKRGARTWGAGEARSARREGEGSRGGRTGGGGGRALAQSAGAEAKRARGRGVVRARHGGKARRGDERRAQGAGETPARWSVGRRGARGVQKSRGAGAKRGAAAKRSARGRNEARGRGEGAGTKRSVGAVAKVRRNGAGQPGAGREQAQRVQPNCAAKKAALQRRRIERVPEESPRIQCSEGYQKAADRARTAAESGHRSTKVPDVRGAPVVGYGAGRARIRRFLKLREAPFGCTQKTSRSHNLMSCDGTVFGKETREAVQPKRGSDQRNSMSSDVQRTSNQYIQSIQYHRTTTESAPKIPPKTAESQPVPTSNPPPRHLTFTAENVSPQREERGVVIVVTHRVLYFSLFFSPPLPRSAASSFSASTAPTAQATCETVCQLDDTKDYAVREELPDVGRRKGRRCRQVQPWCLASGLAQHDCGSLAVGDASMVMLPILWGTARVMISGAASPRSRTKGVTLAWCPSLSVPTPHAHPLPALLSTLVMSTLLLAHAEVCVFHAVHGLEPWGEWERAARVFSSRGKGGEGEVPKDPSGSIMWYFTGRGIWFYAGTQLMLVHINAWLDNKIAARGLEQLEIERALVTAQDEDSANRSDHTATSPLPPTTHPDSSGSDSDSDAPILLRRIACGANFAFTSLLPALSSSASSSARPTAGKHHRGHPDIPTP